MKKKHTEACDHLFETIGNYDVCMSCGHVRRHKDPETPITDEQGWNACPPIDNQKKENE